MKAITRENVKAFRDALPLSPAYATRKPPIAEPPIVPSLVAVCMTALYDVFWKLIVHNENFLEEIDQAIYWDATKHAPQVRVPTLVAAGGLDLTFRPWCSLRLHEMIPRSQFVLFSRGSHDWLCTHPHEFATMVECFVEQSNRRKRVDNLASR